jgi:hypothetical protein
MRESHLKQLLALALAASLPATSFAGKGPANPERALKGTFEKSVLGRSEARVADSEAYAAQVAKTGGNERPIESLSRPHLVQRAETESLRALNMTFLTGLTANDPSFGGEAVANHVSLRPALSGNGNFVAFTSLAGNLVSGDTNGMADVFRYQIDSDTIEMVSLGAGDGSSGMEEFVDGLGRHMQLWQNSISTDGNLVCFTSTTTNNVATDTNLLADVFVRDMAGSSFARVSVDQFGLEFSTGRSMDGALAGDGSAVAFASLNTFGNAADQNSFVNASGLSEGGFDIFWKDLSGGLAVNGDQTGALRLVSHQGNGTSTTVNQFNFGSGLENAVTVAMRPSISADGRFVVYDSNNPRVRPTMGLSSINFAVYLWDRDATPASAENQLVSRNANGTVNNGDGPSPTSPANAAYCPHISPDGNWIAFTSTLDLTAAIGDNGFPLQYVRRRDDASTIRAASADEAGGLFSTLSFRGGSPTVDNDGNVTFYSAGDLLDGNGLTDVYFKAFDAAPPANTGPLLHVSRATDGSTNTRGISGYGDAFLNGAHDQAWHDSANNRFIFSHEAPQLDTTGPGTFALRNIFMATHDATPAITVMEKVTQGDVNIDAAIALNDSVRPHAQFFSAGPQVSSNGQWLGFTGWARNHLFGGSDFNEDFGEYPTVVNLSTGQAFAAGRDPDGTYYDEGNPTSNFGDAGATFEDIGFGEIFPRITLFANWGLDVNDQGGFSFYTLAGFDGAASGGGHVVWAPTATAATREVRSEATNLSITLINGAVFLQMLQTPAVFTSNGRYIFFISDASNVATGFPNNGVDPVQAPYRYDTQTNDIITLAVDATGTTVLDDVFFVDASDSGDRAVLFNDSADLAFDLGTLSSQTDHLWLREVSTSRTFMVETNSAGAPGTTLAPSGQNFGKAFGPEVSISGDGGSLIFSSNASNLVPGVAADDDVTTQVYVKTITGVTANAVGAIPGDTGAVVCLSVSNVDGMAIDNVGGEDAFFPSTNAAGNIFAFSSSAGDLTGAPDADANGDQVDVFYTGDATFGGEGSDGNLRIASKNASDEQFTFPSQATADKAQPFNRDNFAFVVFEVDAADVREDLAGGPAISGAASSTPSLWLASFSNGMTAADDSWALFE